MEVKLLASYPDESIAYRASGICIGKQGSEKGMKSALSQGHFSIIEHLPVTFEIGGISRACSHQLVRHRLASYSQESQRYVASNIDVDKLLTILEYTCNGDYEAKEIIKEYVVIPPSILNTDEEEVRRYAVSTANSLIDYKIFMEDFPDIPSEDARFMLPNSMKTKLLMTINARTLVEICRERLCEQAQWEIRELLTNMKNTIQDVYPTVYSYCKPKCRTCTEIRPCSRKVMSKLRG